MEEADLVEEQLQEMVAMEVLEVEEVAIPIQHQELELRVKEITEVLEDLEDLQNGLVVAVVVQVQLAVMLEIK